MINCLWNLSASVFPNKWRFNSIQDLEIFAFDFERFSTDNLADESLRALGFLISATTYLEERSSRFTDVTDLELTAKSAMVDNSGWLITDSEKKIMKKKNKCTAEIKERFAKHHSLVRSPSSCHPRSPAILFFRYVLGPISCLGSPTILLSSCVLALVFSLGFPANLLSRCVPAPVSYPRFPAVVSSCCVSTSISSCESLAIFLSCHLSVPAASATLSSFCHALVFCSGISVLLLLFSVLSACLFLGFSLFKTLKRFLLDKLWPYMLTSRTKFFCLFQALGTYNPDNNNGLYNPTNTNKLKRGFDTPFINSRPLAVNHDQKEVDLSFAGCG